MNDSDKYRKALEVIRDYCDNAIAQGAWDTGDGRNVREIFDLADKALDPESSERRGERTGG